MSTDGIIKAFAIASYDLIGIAAITGSTYRPAALLTVLHFFSDPSFHFWRVDMSDQKDIINFYWGNYTSVAILTLISYEYLLLLEKEVKYVWTRRFSPMSFFYLVARYLGLFLTVLCGCWGGLWYMPVATCYGLAVLIEWGFSVYFCFAEVILMWRLYALYNRSKRLLYVLLGSFLPIVALSTAIDIYLYSRSSAFSVNEIVTPIATYCALSFKTGPRLAIYTYIPIICYDIFLVVLAVAILIKHLKVRRDIKMRLNASILMIVQYHIIYFVLNLLNQILLVILWTGNTPMVITNLSELFNSSVPFILAPRLIISIWDRHAEDECENVSTTFADCVCWTRPTPVGYEMDCQMSQITLYFFEDS